MKLTMKWKMLPESTKRFLPVVVAVVAGLLAVGLLHNYLTGERQKLAAERQRLHDEYQAQIGEIVEVIVAKKDLSEGTLIVRDSHLKLAKVPRNFVQPFATGRSADLVGQVTIAPIAEGEQVLRNKVRPANELPLSATLSGLTPEGKRAITIGTDALLGVGGFIRPGDNIDILWTVKLPEVQGGDTVTMMLFQNVSVLAVGNQMIGRPTDSKESGDKYTVTLAMTPQEASLLMYARTQGNIQLSLRPRNDKGEPVAVPPANSRAVMEAVLGKAVGVDTPKPPRTVEIFRGLDRSVVPVKD